MQFYFFTGAQDIAAPGVNTINIIPVQLNEIFQDYVAGLACIRSTDPNDSDSPGLKKRYNRII